MTAAHSYSFAALHNRLRVTGQIEARTALRIGAGRATGVVSSDLPVLRDSLGRPFLPGASLKGTLRAQLESLIHTVAPQQALDLPAIQQRMSGEVAKLKERAANDQQLSAGIWALSTMIDLTFGAPWLASRLFIKDAAVDPLLWFGQFETRNGVALNRDTETAEDGLLYDYEVVPAGVRFPFELVLENAAPWQLGMITLALKPWQRGEAQIGGFRSRGLGYVQLLDAHSSFRTITTVDDVIALLDPPEALEPVTQAQEQEWVAAFRDELRSKATGATDA